MFEMARKKYGELRKKRLKERGERFKRERERIEEQEKALQERKMAEAARRKRVKTRLLQKEKLEEDQRKKAKDALTSTRAAVEEAETKSRISLYVSEITQEISEIMKDADKSFSSANYEKTIKLSYEIKELVEKARLDASRKAEEKRRIRKETGKYFYCVIPFSEEKSFGNIGMNNSEVYAIPYRDLAAVVCDSPMKECELTEENTRKHEAVLRQVMGEHTVVPVEFGTTIKNEKVLRRLLTKAYDPTRECLRLVDNTVELGVKAVLNEDIVFVDVEKRKECTSNIFASLNTIAKQSVTGDLFSDRLILNASFLVDKEATDLFSEKVSKLQDKYPMLKMLYSGPWAPYNFVYIKIGAKGIEVTKKR